MLAIKVIGLLSEKLAVKLQAGNDSVAMKKIIKKMTGMVVNPIDVYFVGL